MRLGGIPQQQYSQRPGWSSDGRRVAYTIPRSGLWIVNADGSGQRRLAPMGYYCHPPQPQWLRDDEHSIYCAAGETLSVVSVQTRKTQRIWRTFSADEIERSPTTNTIAAISSHDHGQALYLIEPGRHRAPRRIVRGPVGAAGWSGEWRHLLLEKHGQIWVIKTDGTGLRELTRCAYRGGECIGPEWLAQQPKGFPLVTWSQVN